MSRCKDRIYAISMFVFVGLVPVSGHADPVDASKLDNTALRALFSAPAFNTVCPLAVYDEDYSKPAVLGRPTPGARRADAPELNKPAVVVIREMPRSHRSVYSDGLNDYGENFNNAKHFPTNLATQ